MAAALFVCFTESSHVDSQSVEAFQFLLKSPMLHSIHQVVSKKKVFFDYLSSESEFNHVFPRPVILSMNSAGSTF